MKKIPVLVGIVLWILGGPAPVFSQNFADTIFSGGDILTLNSAKPSVEALAVKEGKILALGSFSEILKLKGPQTQMQNLKEATLLPGFIEAHGHPMDSAFAQFFAVDIRPFSIKNQNQMNQTIQARVRQAKAGEWLVFYGLDTLLQKGVSTPTLEQLNQGSPKNPLVIFNNSGHAAYANSLALQLANITEQSPNPPGGKILKDSSGKLSGTLQELPAVNLVLLPIQKKIAPSQMVAFLRKYYDYLASNGITTSSDMAFDAAVLPIYQALEKEAGTPLRIRLYEVARPDRKAALPPGGGSDLVKQNGIKWWVDGSPWLGNIGISQAYLNNDVTLKQMGLLSNSPGSLNYPNTAELQKWVNDYFQQGYQIAIHAEGDKAIDQALDVMETAAQKYPKIKPNFRLEHIPMATDAQLARAKKLNIPVTFLMAHVYYWGDVLPLMFGEARASRWDPVASAQKAGLEYSFHNDGAVTPENPLLDFQIATLRNTQSGKTLGVEQAISLDQAIRARTLGAAYQLGMEKEIGSLEVGKWADLVVLNKNPYKTKAEEIIQIKILATYLNGKKVWPNKTLE